MGTEPNNFRDLPTEINAARNSIETRDLQTIERVDELERVLNEVLVGMRRPGSESYGDDCNNGKGRPFAPAQITCLLKLAHRGVESLGVTFAARGRRFWFSLLSGENLSHC